MKKMRMHEHEIHPTAAGPRVIDPVRNQFVPAGPEELVRQSVIHVLQNEYGYPLAALRSEELIDRGGKELRRADVFVMLPQAENSPEVTIAPANPEGPSVPDPLYSVSFAVAQADFGKIPGIRIIQVPDQLIINIDGEEVASRPLGFDWTGYGYDLIVKIPSKTAAQLNITEYIRYRVLGFGLTDSERNLAGRLNLPELSWTEISNADFHKNWEDFVQQIEFPNYYGTFTSSENGRSGWLTHHSAHNAPGVLVFFDSKAKGLKAFLNAQEAEAHDDEEVEENCEGELGHEAGADAEDQYTPGEDSALIVVECKAPNVNYTESVLNQGLYYAQKRGALFLVVTNGERWTQTYFVEKGEVPQEIEELPTYQEAISGKYQLTAVAASAPHFPLPNNPLAKPDVVRIHVRNRYTVGCDTPEKLWPVLLALDDFFLNSQPLFREPFSAYGIQFLKDEGAHFLEVGNSSGGRYPGMYRQLLLKLPSGQHTLFGCGLFAKLKGVGRKLYGNCMSITTLIGALSFDAALHPSIECCMDRSLILDDHGNHLVRHDGKITVGMGAVSPAKLTEFIEQRNQALVDGKKFNLGTIPSRFPLRMDDVRDFLTRFVSYVLLRDEFKREVRVERKSRK